MSDDEQGLGLGDVFTEPPRPPTPPPTIAIYDRDAALGDDWKQIQITLVGSHPLWGHYLWNASRSFASFLDRNRALCKDRDVLELGAGGGLPGLVAAKLGARKVVSTDYPDIQLIENIMRNGADNLTHEELERFAALGYVWGASVKPLLETAASGDTEAASFDLIIMSDLVFNHSQHDALLKSAELTLSSWLGRPARGSQNTEPCLLVFYSHHRPHLAHRDLEFFQKAEARGWCCEEIVTERFPPMFPEDPGEEEVRATVHGWRLTRRAV
ncbi:hypothetical protein PENSPDRAFT_750827 [Peniophora sp. CONT]|nr:hypothetical protein PENSPDRAFT_750827 [Peniophora sp. CONT]